MCRTVIARAFAAAALAAGLAGTPSVAGAQALNQLFVEALDARTGAPVTDLRPTDFRVEEDGSPGGIVSADIGDAPMKVALLVDNGDVLADTNAISDLRRALDDFLDTLAPAHEVGLFTIARQTRRRVDFTVDRVELKSGVGEIFPDRGGSVRVFDGVRDTMNRRFEDNEAFPVFVLVLTDGSEGSGYVTPGEFAELGQILIDNAVTIHTVLLSMRGGSEVTSISNNLSQNTGRRVRGHQRVERARRKAHGSRHPDERALRPRVELVPADLRAAEPAGVPRVGPADVPPRRPLQPVRRPPDAAVERPARF